MKLKKPHRLPLFLLGAIFLGLSGAVGARLYGLQYARHEHYTTSADRQHYKRVVIQPERGDVLDSNGLPLAQSTGRLTIYVNPTYFKPPTFEGDLQKMAEAVARETGAAVEDVARALSAKRPTALVKRLRPEAAERAINVLEREKIDGRGFWLHRESIRLYPRHLASNVIGFCRKDADGDNVGISGLEFGYSEELSGRKITGRSPRSGISETMQPWEQDDLLAARGNTLVLTLDANVQEAAEVALARAMEKWKAVGGGAVVLDSQTGAVIAMASAPTFDNNEFSTAPGDSIRNRVLTDPLETGSVVKLYTAAILIDQGIVTPNTMVDCENGYAVVNGRRLHDSPGHYLGMAPFREVLRWSSNIGIVKVAQELDNDKWYEYLQAFGLGRPTGVDLPGEGSGILYPVGRWTRLSRTSLPMGYELSLTSLQIAAGISAIVNGGNYYKPYIVSEVRDSRGNLVRKVEPQLVRQVIRPTTSAIMRDLMEDIVSEGTGKKARIPGYRIGGKTGTTRKSNIFDRREYIASFVGVLPVHNPRLTIYCYIDAPEGEYYASIVAAPVFEEIARAAVLHLGIPPSEIIEDLPAAATAKGRRPVAEPRIEAIEPAFGTLPSFLGKSMSEVRNVIGPELKSVKFIGTGFVTDQSPVQGSPMNAKTDLVLYFQPRAAAPPPIAIRTAVRKDFH